MIKEFIFTVGLPGCGKSTYLNEHYFNVLNEFRLFNEINTEDSSLGKIVQEKLDGEKCKENNLKPVVIISADDLKPLFNGYNEEHPEFVHEKSVQLAKYYVEYFSTNEFFNDIIVMDGGAINNHYTENIIKFIREHCPKCKITAIFFDTPVNVCLERINNRSRKVPKKAIYEKSMKLRSCVYKYRTMVDEFIRVDYFTNKYIFLDMDGTICGYTRAKNDGEGNDDFVNGKLFRYLHPVKHVIGFVKEHYNMDNVYICTACPNSIAWQEKNEWLNEYFPEIPIENRLFCGNKYYKHVFIQQFANGKKMKLNEVVLIDDFHDTIKKCLDIGINCIHPSNIDSLTDQYAIFG